MDRTIFVFGSNLAGRHGKGAALAALRHGAVYGQGVGLHGSSYAIPTKDERLRSLPLPAIEGHVYWFLVFAREHPELTFRLTPIGCGLAGYKPEQIAPMFAGAPPNVVMPDAFARLLKPNDPDGKDFPRHSYLRTGERSEQHFSHDFDAPFNKGKLDPYDRGE